MTINFVDLDVRPILRDGGEPFAKIMQTVSALGPDEGIRLLATFKPVPLFSVLGSKGFTHEAREIGDGDWEVLFRRSGEAEAEAPPAEPAPADDGAWPEPVQHLDNRDLDPPEPMVRILATIETMAPGQVLSALLCREPMFLFPELAKRGHSWQGAFEADGTTYKILVRVNGNKEAAA
ncbi:MAG: universal stress protein [Alphaproteobacteria bacterium HGW-Alphaproteobacteria-5]|nr:MAG: universal stress protein [Alphaproteobacteria bacterium HGW-Alphaproteobacteria-5]